MNHSQRRFTTAVAIGSHVFLLGVLALLISLGTAPLARAEESLDRYVELLRSDVKGQKTAILTQALALNDAESAAFWPLYRDYEVDLSRWGDARYALIKRYAAAYNAGTVDDATAAELATSSLKLMDERTQIYQKHYNKIAKGVSPMRGAQFLQVENQINSLIDLRLAAEIPFLAKSK